MNKDDLNFAELIERYKHSKKDRVVNVVKLDNNKGFVAHLADQNGGPVMFANTEEEARKLMEKGLLDFDTIVASLAISDLQRNAISAGLFLSILNHTLQYEACAKLNKP